MMKVCLVTPTPQDISAFGVRSLSSFLKEHGHQVRCIFLPGGIELLRHRGDYIYKYPTSIIEKIADLCSDADLVGISFMSQYFDRALQITKHLKTRLTAPIIWGGIHPTCAPKQCLEHVDMVCIGEGEQALLQLCERLKKGEKIAGCGNIALKSNGKIHTGRLLPYLDIDQLPHFDYSLDGHYLYQPHKERIIPMTADVLHEALPLMPAPKGGALKVYRTMISRGCPHQCSYCSNSTLQDIFGRKGFLRRRSPQSFIEHLCDMVRRYPFIEGIHFIDDTFFAASMGELERFAELYAKKVRLPFYTQVSPNTISKSKMELLLDAGMVYTEMGIQTGSPRIRSIFNRSESNEKIKEAAHLISDFKGRLIPPSYHVILDTPWESLDDKMQTLKLLLSLKKPYRLCLSSLIFFPDTPLYKRAVDEGMISDISRDILRHPFFHPKQSYANYLVYLCGLMLVPRFAIRILANRRIVKLLYTDKAAPLVSALFKLTRLVELGYKGIKAILRGDTRLIGQHLRRPR